MTAKRELAGAVVVVTGGGSGVGAAVAALCAQAGAVVVVSGRDADKLQQTRERAGGAVHCVAGDVGDSAFCNRCVQEVVAQHGKLNVLVNNAGIIRRGTAAETDDAEWAEVMRTNVDGVFYMSRAAVQAMTAAGQGGAIVNTASTCGLVGAAGLAAYCTSKGAVVQLTRTMALECAAQRITVNAVCPGAIEAPMLFSAHSDGSDAEAVRARNRAAIPAGELASAEEVARAIIYLACEPHITGSMLSIDGGYTAG